MFFSENAPLWIFAGKTIVSGLIGMILHEFSHYVPGKIFGGKPYFDDYSMGFIPRRVNFQTPERMPNWGVRIAGGIVLIWPGFAGIVLAVNDLSGVLSSLPLLILLGTASMISWSDLLALSDPDKWKRYTEGEPISHSK